MTWCPPPIALKWGSYFAPDADDDTKIVDVAIKAHDAGLVTIRSAVGRIQRTFNIENVDQFVEALGEEKAAAMKQQQKLAADALKADSGDEDGEDDTDDGEGDEPGTRSRRGGGFPARKA